MLDIEIFTRYFAKAFSINVRYAGTEPRSVVTEKYNRALAEHLPKQGVEFVELKRIETDGAPVSASLVREHIKNGELDELKSLLPQTTLDYLKNNNLI